MTETQSEIRYLQFVLTLAVPIALGLIGLTGWILSGIAMRPIQQSYQQLQRFTSDASHELRSPLSAILTNAQVGLLSVADNLQVRPRWLENLAVDYAAQAATQDIKLISQLPEQPIQLLADPDLLRQAIENLLSNACKHASWWNGRVAPGVPIELGNHSGN
ncbi:hypothetical protein K9N68_08320 [Kovacikia minuta CCNUW1]|uniref:sensor histidine kinase n=1 Tax=Kovacikia minuta TaxID=2931930 RepID=UPI001CCAFC72|nr:hypothetical protein K9N68_08320 [Kovacikia minuta CCNUW1]